MKRKAIAAIAVLAVLLLASCATTSGNLVPEAMSQVTDVNVLHAPEPTPAPAPEPEPEPLPQPAPEPAVEAEVITPIWTVGQTGPNGGLVFCCDSKYLEVSDPFYETPSFDGAVGLCESLSAEKGIAYRLPTIAELNAIYEQLVVSELLDVDWTYYWSCEQEGEDAVKILNFDTGFEGSFYKDMDFVSAIPVTEI